MRTLEQILKDKAQFERDLLAAQAKIDGIKRELRELHESVSLAIAA